MDIKDILARCDHTLLRTDCTAEIRALCDDAIRFGCASVCIPPAHVAGAGQLSGRMAGAFSKYAACRIYG